MTKRPYYSTECIADPGIVCPAKCEIVEQFTGDASGATPVDGGELAEHMLNAALRNRDQNAIALGCQGLNTEGDCSVREEVNSQYPRKLAAGPARKLLELLTRQR